MSENALKKPSKEVVLQALAIYESEWEHRDIFMRTMVFTLFYATLICDLIPFIKAKVEWEKFEIPMLIFPITGLLLTVYFLFVALAYSARMEAASETINNMMKLLPAELRRVELAKTSFKDDKFVMERVALWTPLCMFLVLLGIDLVSFDFILLSEIGDDKNASWILAVFTILILVGAVCWVKVYGRKHKRSN